jgi:uncharacterized repeat protein (TIGR01451 family)
MVRYFVGVFCAALMLGGSVTSALAKPTVALHLQGALVERDASGSEKLTPIDGVALQPGETVRYTIVATNVGTDPALGLRPTARIPAGTAYDVGSASKNAQRVEFSIDGGKTWSTSPMVRVQTQTGVVEKKADPSLYTMLRWVGGNAIGPKVTQVYSYAVRIK